MSVAVVRHDPGDPFRQTLLDLEVCEKTDQQNQANPQEDPGR